VGGGFISLSRSSTAPSSQDGAVLPAAPFFFSARGLAMTFWRDELAVTVARVRKTASGFATLRWGRLARDLN